MIKLVLLAMLGLLLAACSVQGSPTPVDEPAIPPDSLPQAPGEAEPITPLNELDAPDAAAEDGVVPANCASAETNRLGAAIAADYAFTSTEQVMAWFCAGAEFEDILVALETSDQTGQSAEEMLTMLAAGLSWEEIWQVVGLTGEQP